MRARVIATADTEQAAQALAQEVQVSTDGGQVRATGPERGDRRSGWHVSFEVWVPGKADVTVRTRNGGISIADVSGTLLVEAVNGGVSLSRLSGDVRGTTVNGGISVELGRDRWQGAGLDARTTNGGLRLKVPDGYSCQLGLSTVNGRMRADFPMTVQGRLGHRLDLPLGRGGAPVRLTTTNGGVHVTR